MEKELTIKNKPKRRKKWFLRIIYFLVILFLVVDFFLFFLATPILKNFLQQKVSEQTNGLFFVDFDRISIELGSRRLALENFELLPDTAVYNQLILENKTQAALYKITCKSVELWRIRPLSLFFRSKLRASNLNLINPVVELKKLPGKVGNKIESRDFVHEDLFPAIKTYLSEVSINMITLKEGKFLLSLKKDSVKTTTHFGNVSVKLEKFFLNEEEHLQKKKLFFSNELQIEIEDYKINLSDKIHYLYADYIIISSKNSRLMATNVGINTISQSRSFINKLKTNYYRISSPQIEFNNFNIYNLYFKNDIKIGNIICQNPNIELVNILKDKVEVSGKINKSLEIDLSKLIQGKLNSIAVDTLNIENGKLKFYYNSWFNMPSYKANSITLDLYKFQIDEFSNYDRTKLFYSRNIHLLLDTFTAVLPDKEHIMQVNQVVISSLDESLSAGGISLKKRFVNDSLNTNTNLNIRIPSLNVSGIDFFSLYHDRVLNISKLGIGKSDFELTLPGSTHKKRTGEAEKNILSIIISNFIERLSIKYFSVAESNFKITNFYTDSSNLNYQGRVYFELDNFNISDKILNSDDSRLFYTENFKLGLIDYSQDLKDRIHVLYSKNLEVSTKDSIIEFSGFAIHPRNGPDVKNSFILGNKIINFSVIQAFIRNVDLNRAFNDSIVEAGSISIFRPSINVENYLSTVKTNENNDYGSIDSLSMKIGKKERKYLDKNVNIRNLLTMYFKRLDINALTIEDADFRMSDVDSSGNNEIVMSGKLSAKLNKFYFNPQIESDENRISYSENISFRLNDFFSKIFNKKYQLKIKQVAFSSRDSSITANIVRFFPSESLIKSDISDKDWTFYAPEIRTNHTRIETFLDYNILDMGSLEISSPSIVLIKKSEIASGIYKRSEDTLKKRIGFNKIKFDGIDLKNGVFGILNHVGGVDRVSLNTKIEAHINRIEFDSSVLVNPSQFFEELEASVNLSDLNYQLADSLRKIEIKKVRLNSGQKTIDLQDFVYENKGGFYNLKGNADLKNLTIPQLSFTGFRLEKLLMDKEISSSGLYINHPYINIYKLDEQSESNKFKLSELNLYDKIKKNLNVVDINKVLIDSASFDVSRLESSNAKTSVIKNVYANISNLRIDSTVHQSDRILSSDDVLIGIKDYDLDFSKDLYKLNIRDMGFSTKGNLFFAKSVSINPNVDRSDYVKERQKESNLIYLKTSEIIASGVDLINFIDNNKLTANNLDFFDLRFQNYKNKQFPMDSILRESHPLEYLHKLKRIVKIDTVNFHDSYIGTEILGKNALESGILDFTQVNGKIFNLCNDPNSISNNEETVITASGYLVNKSLLTASMHIPLGSKNGEYFYGGTLDTFDMTELNPFIENLYFVSIKNGLVNGINFKVNANEDYASGELTMNYENLKIDVISKKKSDTLEIENRGLFSMVANSIIRDSNPKRYGGFTKVGRIYFERNIYKPVFNYWTAAPMSGVQSTLGFKSKQFKERLKIEKESEKYGKFHRRRKNRIDRRSAQKMEKQIEKELKEESKYRKKEQKRSKRLQKNKV